MAKAGELFIKKELLNRRDFVKGLLGGCFMLMTGCSHEDVLGRFGAGSGDVVLGEQYGTGEDGDITVTGMSVSIVDIYENDDCTGVITKNGENRGLNGGPGTYTKTRGLHCGNFTVNTGASVTAVTFDGDLEKTGNVVIRCTGELTVRGKIDVNGKGGAGGNPGSGNSNGTNGTYTGAGHFGTGSCNECSPCQGIGGVQGISYGSPSEPEIGSGGGGGGGYEVVNKGNTGGGYGGAGGGLIRVFSNSIRVYETGGITACGGDGQMGSWWKGWGGGGGSGSGGGIYIETFSEAILGDGLLTASGGSHVDPTDSGMVGGAGGGGSYATEGETGYGGISGDNGVRAGGNGRIAVKSKNITGTTTPAYYDIEKGAYS